MSEPEAELPPAVEVHAGVAGVAGAASGDSGPDDDKDDDGLDIQHAD